MRSLARPAVPEAGAVRVPGLAAGFPGFAGLGVQAVGPAAVPAVLEAGAARAPGLVAGPVAGPAAGCVGVPGLAAVIPEFLLIFNYR